MLASRKSLVNTENDNYATLSMGMFVVTILVSVQSVLFWIVYVTHVYARCMRERLGFTAVANCPNLYLRLRVFFLGFGVLVLEFTLLLKQCLNIRRSEKRPNGNEDRSWFKESRESCVQSRVISEPLQND